MADALLLPAYQAPGSSFAELVAILAATGLANRNAPSVWLNSSAPSWVRGGVPVMWPYPPADAEWTAYLSVHRNISFRVAPDAGLCTLLSDAKVAPAIRGLVVYDDPDAAPAGTDGLDGLRWAAVTAAGLYSGVPVTAALRAAHADCLQHLPVVFTVPPASSFADNLAVCVLEGARGCAVQQQQQQQQPQ